MSTSDYFWWPLIASCCFSLLLLGIFDQAFALMALSDSTIVGNSAVGSGGGVVNAGTMTIATSLVRGNTAAVTGGGILVSAGTVLIINRTQLEANTAPSGYSFFSTGGETQYQLPAPPGMWIAGARCIVFRGACPPLDNACEAAREACSEVAGAVVAGCQDALFLQPCDWDGRPELLTEVVQVLPTGALDDDYPFRCASGLRGSADAAFQAGPQCAGPCQAGTYQPETGSVTCFECPLGAFCPEGAANPIACPDGTYGSQSGLTSAEECVECPDGAWCNSGQAFACGVGLYSAGTNRTDLGACRPCPDEHATTFSEGTAAVEGCVCAAGFLANPAAATLACMPCQSPLSCASSNTTLATIVVDAGHWRPGFGTVEARACPQRDACANGTVQAARYDRFSDATCISGRGLAGTYCVLCMEPQTHFFDAAQPGCRPCADATAVLLLLGALGLALAATLLAWRWLPRRLASTAWWRILIVSAARVSFHAKLRVVIGFVQIVTQLERSYDLRFPPSFSALVRSLSFVNVDLLGWLPGMQLRCLGVRALSSQLLVATLAPLAVAATPLLFAALRHQPLASAAPAVLAWTFLVFPAISSFGFRSLAPCDCFGFVDGTQVCFLREDLEVECTGPGPASAPPDVVAAAWAAVGVWAVGVLALYAGLLRSDRRCRLSTGMLGGDYKPAAAGWEVVVIGEKVLLTGFLALVDPGSWTQLFLGMVIALFAFVLQARVAPFKSPSDNLFAFIASLALVAILLASLGLQSMARAPELGIDETLLLATLFAFTLLVLLAALGFFVAELRGAREILLVRATGLPPTLTLAEGKRYHLFLSHNWDNQDVVATIKRQLQLLLPGIAIFLDVDDLQSVDDLELYVKQVGHCY